MHINTSQKFWRRSIYLLALGLISGCASTGINQAPEYSQQQNALLAPGYPVERIDDPDGARLVDSSSSESRDRYDISYGNFSEQVKTNQAVAMWVDTEDDHIVAIALHRGLQDSQSSWTGGMKSDGVEEAGGRRFGYIMRSGLYEELVSGNVASEAPECGVSVGLKAPVYRSNKATYLEYTEGIPCGKIVRHGEDEQSALRERAYRFFGITRKSQPEPSESGVSYLEREARNHLVCMSAYSVAISPCTDIASNKKTASKINKNNSEIAEDYSLEPGYYNSVTADDVGETCIGKRTDEVFGDPDAAANAPSGSGSLPSDNSPEETYDWAADGLSEEVQSVLDRIYAKPDVEAPEWLQKPVGRMLGHRERARVLLEKEGLTQQQIRSVLSQYGANSNYDLAGNHPKDQSTIYKIKACLNIL